MPKKCPGSVDRVFRLSPWPYLLKVKNNFVFRLTFKIVLTIYSGSRLSRGSHGIKILCNFEHFILYMKFVSRYNNYKKDV